MNFTGRGLLGQCQLKNLTSTIPFIVAKRSRLHAANTWLIAGVLDWHWPISAQARYVQKIASIELVCVFQRPYRSERAHDSGDMGARTPQQDEVFFECDPLKVFAWFPVASPACAVDRFVLTMRTIVREVVLFKAEPDRPLLGLSMNLKARGVEPSRIKPSGLGARSVSWRTF